MSAITRQHIEMTAKLYMHKDFVLKAKQRSPETYKVVHDLLVKYSAKHKMEVLEAAIEIGKKPEMSTSDIMWLLGVACILIEDEKPEPTT